MKKYLGIIKKCDSGMSGTQIHILTKTYNDIRNFNKWYKLYPNCEHTVLLNNSELDSIFKDFKDPTPVTENEKKEAEKAKKLYKELVEK